MRRPEALTHPWAGFELAPEGCLFEQKVNLDGAMGVAYERSLKFKKRTHVHDRPLLVFPRGGTRMRITTPRPRCAHDVTSNELLIVPAHLPHADHWGTEVYDTFALFPRQDLISRCARRLGLDSRAFERIGLYARSGWLESLIAEYFDERIVRPGRACPRGPALEELLVMEVLRLACPPFIAAAQGPRGAEPSSLVARALRQLEGNLFAPFDLMTLCRTIGTSRSSLLRQFRSELDTTPRAYVLGRRLDEARRLLASGRHSVGEVAQLVGYDSFSAFSEAFRRKFRVTPSAARHLSEER